MKIAISLLAILLFFPSTSIAEIEKTAVPSDQGIRFLWWPKVKPPAGWHFDKGSSYFLSFNALAPNGGTFSRAETVMYAKATFKPRIPNAKSLDGFMHHDIADFLAAEPGLAAKPEGMLRSAEGKDFRVVAFTEQVRQLGARGLRRGG